MEGVDGERLRRLGSFLRRASASCREIGYRDAEDLAGRLAARLRDTLAPEDLEKARFHPIPRGGWIVLGMLSYHLGPLTGGDDSGPLVVVDDCALSGLRLRETLGALRRHPGGDRKGIVVAHLLSPPPLRRAVEEEEPRVLACLAGGDVEDRTEALYPDPAAREAWRRRWSDLAGAEARYWLGMAELVTFPWNEPDRPFWNEALGRLEDGWRFVPPHRCLKTRADLVRGLPPVDPGPPFWHLADGVVWGDFGDRLWLCPTPSEEVFSVSDSARLCLRAVLAGLGSEGAAKVVARTYQLGTDGARRDVDGLIADLERRRILVAAPDPRGAGD